MYDGPIDGFSTTLFPGCVFKVADGSDVWFDGECVTTCGSFVELKRSDTKMDLVYNVLGPIFVRWFTDGWKDQSWINKKPTKPKTDWQPLMDKSTH